MSFQTIPRELANALLDRLESDKPMSVEERRLIALDLERHMDETEKEVMKTKEELGRYQRWAELGDVAGHVFTLLQKSVPDLKFGTAVTFDERLAEEAEGNLEQALML